MAEEINMTQEEISRANVFSDISQKRISKTKAAEILGISFRHLHRLYAVFQKEGITSLVSRKRGKSSNNQLQSMVKARASELITCEAYVGFGPTFMCEKLQERHNIKISTETTRQLMIQNDVWKANAKKRPAIHQQRKRRARCGELVQIDGSSHAWLEDRGDPCTLIVFIDDATGRAYGKFFETETTDAYMITMKEYITMYGRPLACYADKHGIFRVNYPGCTQKENYTQFGRACKELDIILICANSPQAKGRVERANKTLQDRLVKEMRLARIYTIEEANRFLIGFWKGYNDKFSVLAECGHDAHRKLLLEQDLDMILSQKEYRKVSKNLEIQYENIIYQIVLENPMRSLRGADVTVIKDLKKKIHIEYKGKRLHFKIYSQQEYNGTEIDSKEIDRFLNHTIVRTVAKGHPWKQQRHFEKEMREYQSL